MGHPAESCVTCRPLNSIFIADLMRLRRTRWHENRDRNVNRLFAVKVEAIIMTEDLS
jgi:hypothetical protein